MTEETKPTETHAEPARDPAANGSRAAVVPAAAPARTNPSDFAISLAAKGGTRNQLAAEPPPPAGGRQTLPGFDPEYVDIVDYIVRITHRIWEQKDIGYIYDCYAHNSRVTDDAGLQFGRDKIVADTVHTINAFPDVRLQADEVIWAQDETGAFHTSHRVFIIGHNTGWSRWGAPTGKKVVVWCTANCVARQNEIFEEWVIYNNAHLLMQLGFDVRALARELGNATPANELIGPRGGEVERLAGQAPPPAFADEGWPPVEAMLRRMLHDAWNRRNLSAVDSAYAPTARVHGATGRELYGRGDVKSHILAMLAMFPDLTMHVDDVYFMGNDDVGHLVSVRWTALGTHRGHGVYGRPTGRRVMLWGLSQFRVAHGAIEEEWTVFNEFEVLQQLLRDEPAALVG